MTDRGDRPSSGRPGGSLDPTPVRALALYAVVAAVGGWLLHLVTEWIGTPPVVTWTQPAVLFLVAAMIGATAWSTWRALHVHTVRIAPEKAVNRLVLARASALVGAVVGGGYLGYAVSWIGSQDELADDRGWRSAACSLACLLVVVAGLLLERACRVPPADD